MQTLTVPLEVVVLVTDFLIYYNVQAQIKQNYDYLNRVHQVRESQFWYLFSQ